MGLARPVPGISPEERKQHGLAAIQLFTKREAMGPSDSEEVYYSIFQQAICRSLLGASPWETLGIYLKAFMVRPQRLEALYLAMNDRPGRGCKGRAEKWPESRL